MTDFGWFDGNWEHTRYEIILDGGVFFFFFLLKIMDGGALVIEEITKSCANAKTIKARNLIVRSRSKTYPSRL